MSDLTRSLHKKYLICKIASILLLFLPLMIFLILAFIEGNTQEKVSLGVAVTLTVIFTAANVLFKIAPRSSIWILIIALTIVLEKIQIVIYVTGGCVILEECVTSRLESYYLQKYRINKEIDGRLVAE